MHLLKFRDAVKEIFSQVPGHSRILLLFLALAVILLFPAALMSKSSQKNAEIAGEKLREMKAVEVEYLALRERLDQVEKKDKLIKVEGAVQAVQSVLAPLDMQSKVTSAKSLGSREFKDSLSEEKAEIIFEKLTMNETVNILYHLREAPMMLTIKKAEMKKPFEAKELLNLTLTVSLFTRK